MSQHSPLDKIETVRNTLAILLVMSFICTVPLFIFKTIPEANKEIVTYMVGQLSGMALTALGFYFVNKVGQDALDAQKTANTGLALEAITATANAASAPADEAATVAARQNADAAQAEADAIAHKQ